MIAQHVTTGVYRVRTTIVNAYFVATGAGWVLVDAGLPGSTSRIRDAAHELFLDVGPRAIVLTHAHFDHVGALPMLADEWQVPIYAHPLELPYVMGESAYPPPDPTVGGGLMSMMSALYPRGPYDFRPRVHPLPENGAVPALAGWRWLNTPGHSPGHVSFFRESDRTLIAGDAVVTTKNESLVAALTEPDRVWRPPAYFTPDWEQSKASVRTIAALEPKILATGHGRPLRGEPMRQSLRALAENFDDVRPRTGRYRDQPALTDAHGVVSVPPPAPAPASWRIAAIVGAVMVGGVVVRQAVKYTRA